MTKTNEGLVKEFLSAKDLDLYWTERYLKTLVGSWTSHCISCYHYIFIYYFIIMKNLFCF